MRENDKSEFISWKSETSFQDGTSAAHEVKKIAPKNEK